ncbi:DUF1295 domain-containing protein [Paraburkholderia bannensis]|uniref:DUF1295 domain-containing protein n=1 Tax=Paraburkholderia bannensis TaxID=765414 RepID=UPI002ABE90F6|nr:DUF1295 domain-containing protein [Paraburkholderia bannensis]
MPFAAAFALAFAALVIAFFIAWLVQLRTRNAGMIDPLWAATLGLVAVFAALVGPGAGINRIAVALGGGAWGARLALHLWRRNHRQPEDPRYAALRAAWGAAAAPRMLGFYLVQAVASMVLSIAFFVPAWSAARPPIPLVVAALVTGFAAVMGESTADRQLRRHIADPANRGRVCTSGWWRYSRHPNYFFESLHWCAYTLWSIALPWGWATLAPPCAMAWLLLKVSGVPMLEARLVQSRAGYREYMRTTSAFIPWPPRPAGQDPHRSEHHNKLRDQSERRPHP